MIPVVILLMNSLKMLLTAVLRGTTLQKENYFKMQISLVVKRFLFTARLTVIALDERERIPSADLNEIFWDKGQSWDTNSAAPQQGRTPNDNISKLSFRREFGIVGSFVVRSLARSCLTSVSNASLNLWLIIVLIKLRVTQIKWFIASAKIKQK